MLLSFSVCLDQISNLDICKTQNKIMFVFHIRAFVIFVFIVFQLVTSSHQRLKQYNVTLLKPLKNNVSFYVFRFFTKHSQGASGT